MCRARPAPRSCTIAAVLVFAGRGRRKSSRGRPRYLPAFGTDEAGARGMARPHLGKTHRGLRRHIGRVVRMVETGMNWVKQENVLISVEECFPMFVSAVPALR